MTIKDATQKWAEKYPNNKVSPQTIRNWGKKYGFGNKKNFLPRSEWIIDSKKFNKFLNNPQAYLNGAAK